MTNEELAKYLGLENHPLAAFVVETMPKEKRAAYERLAVLTHELQLWEAGLGPRPAGALIDLIDTKRSTRRRKGWHWR